MSFLHEREQYLKPTADLLPKLAVRGTEILLHLLTNNIYIKGQENIPKDSPFMGVFAYHGGVVEPTLIDIAIRKATGRRIAWITALSHYQEVPGLITHGRCLSIDRTNYDELAIQEAITLLEHNHPTASSIEGTRGQGDKDDLQKLKRAKGGLLAIAYQAKVPVLPVATENVEEIYPLLEATIKKLGYFGFTLDLLKKITDSKNKPDLYISFAPIYTEHLHDEGWNNIRGGVARMSKLHSDIIMLNHIIPLLSPTQTLGYYEGKDVREYFMSLQHFRSEIHMQTKSQ